VRQIQHQLKLEVDAEVGETRRQRHVWYDYARKH